ncbi:hypothetical protein CDD82_5715 [Ophiocordyceps australis]|uniref:Uncharacterized protein n=1 Tax=Ophiocordyceps australis TaxID=1399860 RepID=A0A2C5YZP3_9HYPO|nr:hypothetical protein CDD82_5715 [Ophiocordyceps australis]
MAPDAPLETQPQPRDHGHDSRARRFLTKRLRRDPSSAPPAPQKRLLHHAAQPARLTKPHSPAMLDSSSSLLSSALLDGARRSRVLRHRLTAPPLSVVPDANRGIPRVPSIPSKYARRNAS